MSESLQDLVNRAVFLSTEAQSHFGALLADEDGNAPEWNVDFSDSPSLSFAKEPPFVVTPHMVGSFSERLGSWHWAWDNINGFPPAVIGTAEALRTHTAGLGIAELTEEEVSADEDTAFRHTLVAKLLTGLWTHYPAPAGGGTTVWLLVDHPDLALGEPEIRTLVRSVAAGLQTTTVSDHAAALRSYAHLRGFPLVALDVTEDEAAEKKTRMRLFAADGSADITFDELHRVVNAEMHQPLSPALEAEYAQLVAALPSVPEAPVTPIAPGTAAGGAVPVAPEVVAPEIVAPQAPAPAASAPAAAAEEGVRAPEAPAAASSTSAADAAPTDTQPTVHEEETTEPVVEAPIASPDADSIAESASAPQAPTEPEPAAERTEAGERAEVERTAADERTEAEEQKKPEKKGFFKRLFGR
ncbi:DUF6882 domain-containing protein [Brevibacterium samyangense]|uniref:Uncharacterized protein n=1 Tax=Brevibacterium samyangense TaxID=366888 RepID=A0ABN2TL15_9MICO